MVLAKWLWELSIYVPFIVLAFSYWFFNHPDNTRAMTFQTAADVTTPFFILGVVRALQTLEQPHSIAIVVGVCIAIIVVMLLLERLIRKKVLIIEAIKRIWRVYFLIFTMLYCGIWIFSGIRAISFYIV